MTGPLRLALAALAVWLQCPAALAQSVGATCHTYDEGGAPSSVFAAGDTIVVGGTGFDAGSLVLVDVEQGRRETELARVVTNDIGAFTTSAAVPDTVAVGKAVVRALDARTAASCPVAIAQAGAKKDGGLGKVYLVWGAGLAVFGALLGLMTYRGWKSDRLQEAVDALGWRDPATPPSPHDDQGGERRPDPDLEQPEPDEHAQWRRPEHAPVVVPRDLEPVAEPSDEDIPDDGPEASPSEAAATAVEPEDAELPPGWSQGKSLHEASPAVARLRREARNWKK